MRLGQSQNDPTAKSRALLVANLTPEQRHEFEAKESFTVKVKDEAYEVRPDITERLGDHARFCAVIPGLPVYDQMLARKLYLERDPEAFFKAANLFSPRNRLRDRAYRIDPAFAEQAFRVAVMHAFRQRGMDATLIEITIERRSMDHAYSISLTYARRWYVDRVFDIEHFYNENLEAVLESLANILADKILQVRDRDLRANERHR